MASEKFGDRLRVGVVALHAQFQRLHATQDGRRGIGVQRRAHDLAIVMDAADEVGAPAGETTHHVRMASEEFGGAVEDDVGPKREGLLVDRRREGIVHR